jgi:hypothetical protein
MAEKKEALGKREEKRRREKEATCASFFDLTKRAIEVEETNAKAKAKLLAEKIEIMLIDMTNMTLEQKKRCAIIKQRDA